MRSLKQIEQEFRLIDEKEGRINQFYNPLKLPRLKRRSSKNKNKNKNKNPTKNLNMNSNEKFWDVLIDEKDENDNKNNHMLMLRDRKRIRSRGRTFHKRRRNKNKKKKNVKVKIVCMNKKNKMWENIYNENRDNRKVLKKIGEIGNTSIKDINDEIQRRKKIISQSIEEYFNDDMMMMNKNHNYIKSPMFNRKNDYELKFEIMRIDDEMVDSSKIFYQFKIKILIPIGVVMKHKDDIRFILNFIQEDVNKSTSVEDLKLSKENYILRNNNSVFSPVDLFKWIQRPRDLFNKELIVELYFADNNDVKLIGKNKITFCRSEKQNIISKIKILKK